MIDGIDRAPAPWEGRVDGQGRDYARWHSIIQPAGKPEAGPCLIGFASDEGVRRNHGRVGAAEGPSAIRGALANLTPRIEVAWDAGDVVVAGSELEAGQDRLGRAVGAVLEAGGLPVVLGGGHEVAYGTSLGWAGTRGVGILNLDAHFDLREAPVATSGTPFRQIADRELSAGRGFRYAVVGISAAGNTRRLFDTARALGVTHLADDCDEPTAAAFVAEFLAGVDFLHLSIDLDVLPAAVAPGVSAPAGFGVPLSVVRTVGRIAAASGKLRVLEVAELNPRFDSDSRTARTAARLIDEILAALPR